jgi:hypothetical protein
VVCETVHVACGRAARLVDQIPELLLEHAVAMQIAPEPSATNRTIDRAQHRNPSGGLRKRA